MIALFRKVAVFIFLFQLEDLEQSLELEKELAANRLQDLQELHDENKRLTREVDNLSAQVSRSCLSVEHNLYTYFFRISDCVSSDWLFLV